MAELLTCLFYGLEVLLPQGANAVTVLHLLWFCTESTNSNSQDAQGI